MTTRIVELCLGDGPDLVVDRIAAMIARHASAPAAMIHLTDDGERLHVAGAAGVAAGWKQHQPAPASSTLAGLILGHQHPIIITDLLEDPRVPRYAPALALGVRAYAGFPVRDPDDRIVGVCTVLDFEPRVWTPDELAAVGDAAQACAALVADQRRAAELSLELARTKDDYLALIGHELRTPLTSITATIELLRETGPGAVADELPAALEVLSRNSDALQQIIDQLLDLAALDSGHAALACEPLDLAGIVAAAARAIRPLASAAGVTLTTELRTEAVVDGDPVRLRQMADQLLGNAVKHTPGGGLVSVDLERPGPSAVELTITDTGLGIPDDEHDRVFAPFYRTQRTRREGITGNGLGLAMSRAIVEGHRGTIRLVPVAAPGCRVVVRLPAHACH